MDEDELGLLSEAVGASPDVDLPSDRADLALLGEFLERNPDFDTSAPADKLDKLRALQGTDRDVYVPDGDAELDRLIALLKRHDDLELLAKLVGSDDTVALLEALGHDAGGDSAGSAGTTDAAVDDDDGGGWLSGDDEDDHDFLDHEDLDRFGERLSYAAGGLVCLTAVLTAFLTGFTVYRDVDSWVLTLELHDSGAVLVAAAVVALVASFGTGFVYRVLTDDAYDGYRSDLAAATFEVPLFGVIIAGLLYLAAPVLLNLVDLLLVDALLYLIGLVIVLFIAGVPLLVAVFLAVGLVVGLPIYAGVFGGSLLGTPVAAVTSDS